MTETKDYAVQFKIKNNLLLTRMRAAGYETVSQLARASTVKRGSIEALLNLRASGLNAWDQWRPSIIKLAEFLGCMPEDIIPRQHQRSPLTRNTAEIAIGEDDVRAICGLNQSPASLPDVDMRRREGATLISKALQHLEPREERILRLMFGFEGEPQTLDQIGAQYSVSRERVRQISLRAMRKLKRLPNSQQFKDLPKLLHDEEALV